MAFTGCPGHQRLKAVFFVFLFGQHPDESNGTESAVSQCVALEVKPSRVLHSTLWNAAIIFLSDIATAIHNVDGFFLAWEDLGRMFDHSFPACAFFFFFNGN